MVKLLLKTSKVEANLKDNNSQTLLYQATENRHEAVVKLLLKTGKVEADLKNKKGRLKGYKPLDAAMLGY